MNRSHIEAARRVSRLRIALVLLALAALLALGGCGLRHNGANNTPVQTTGQQTGDQPTTSGQSNGQSNGSNSAAH